MLTRRKLLAAAAASLPATAGFAASREKPLRYLQVGVGHAHSNKIEVYVESGDWEVVGIVEEDAELLREAKSNPLYQSFKFFTLEEALNLPDLDVIGVETKVRDLLRYAAIAIDRGCHVHLDKPAGADFTDYQKLMDAADAKGLVVQMGYMYRFNPAVQLLHRMLNEGWLGDVFETHAVMSKLMPPADRRAVAEFPGGTMFELGCHVIDLTVGVLGKPDRVQSHARRVLASNDALSDNMLAVFEYPGAIATVRSTALEVEGFGRRHFTVCGTEGTVHIQPLDRPVLKVSLSKERRFAGDERLYPRGTSEVRFEPPYVRYVGDAADLASTVRGEKENSYPSSHDLAVQDAVLAAAGML
jgi:predicted dehydrogenase